jgi:hypothetical protein
MKKKTLMALSGILFFIFHSVIFCCNVVVYAQTNNNIPVPKLVTFLTATFTTSIIRTEKGAINFLHVEGSIINEGTGTAFNCDLRIMSHTNSGITYTDYYSFNPLQPGQSTYVDTNIFHDNLTSWEIIPECTERPLWFSGLIIISPSNQTYSYSLLTLSVSTKTQQGIDVDIYMNYSLDGKYQDRILTTRQIEPISATFTGATGKVVNVSSFQYPLVTAGNVTLPSLSEGIHNVTVYAKYMYPSYVNPPAIYTSYESSTVYFTVNSGLNTAVETPTPSPSPSPTEQPTLEPTVMPSASPMGPYSPIDPYIIWIPILIAAIIVIAALVYVKKNKRNPDAP